MLVLLKVKFTRVQMGVGGGSGSRYLNLKLMCLEMIGKQILFGIGGGGLGVKL